VERPEYRARTFGALGADFPGVLAAIEEIEEITYREAALAALGHPVSADRVLEAERRWRTKPERGPDDIDEIFDEDVAAYLDLIGHAPASLVPHLLGAARDLRDTRNRAKLVETLAPILPDDLLPTALGILRDVSEREAMVKALAALVSRFRELPVRRLAPLWREARTVLTYGYRAGALDATAALADLVVRLGEEAGTEEVVNAVFEVCGWFP
jgi:hypothetical protein